MRIASSGTVEALDARGEARLRSPAPVIIDASGKRVRGAWTLQGDQLAARWSNDGLAFPIAIDPGWLTTNTMNDARLNFSATLMPDGSVLACGGYGNGTETDGETYVLSSCESFQQATGLWTYAAPLNLARTIHTATLLPDGTVLITGGVNAAGAYLPSAELYKNGVWTVLSSAMTSGRGFHTSTLLNGPNGPEVLLAGGISSSGTPGNYVYTYRQDADLYNVGTGTFAAAAISMVSIHAGHTATLLPNGTVLIAGGVNGPRSTTTISKLAEVFVHTSGAGAFSATSPMNTARQEAAATVLPSGNVLVSGGQVSLNLDGRNVLEYGAPWTEIYTPTGTTSGAWADGGQMTANHSFHTSTLLPSGEVAIYGGTDSADNISGTLELWTDAGFAAGTVENSNGESSQEAVLLPSGRVLIAGGVQDGGTVLNTATLLDQNTPAFSILNLPNGVSGLTSPTVTPLTKYATNPTANLVGPPLLVVADSDAGTGGSEGYVVSETLASGSTATPTVTIGPISGTATFIHFMTGHSATLLLDGRVLIVGGSSLTGANLTVYNAYIDAFLFDPATLTYTQLSTGLINRAPITPPRSSPTAGCWWPVETPAPARAPPPRPTAAGPWPPPTPPRSSVPRRSPSAPAPRCPPRATATPPPCFPMGRC